MKNNKTPIVWALDHRWTSIRKQNNYRKSFANILLFQVLSVRGKESGYTLVHFLVQQLRQSDPELLKWIETVPTVQKCEQVSVKSVSAESEGS